MEPGDRFDGTICPGIISSLGLVNDAPAHSLPACTTSKHHMQGDCHHRPEISNPLRRETVAPDSKTQALNSGPVLQASAQALPALIDFPCEDDEQGMQACSTELSRLFGSLPPSVSLRIAMACPLRIGARMLSMSVRECDWWTDIQLEEEWKWAASAATYAEVLGLQTISFPHEIFHAMRPPLQGRLD
jgi:hypothetical protein